MIGRIRGILIEKQASDILVDVGGVAYELLAPMTTFLALPELEQNVTLFTHLSVSENSQQLFGFRQRQDRDFFRLIIKVNGVGPKMAVGIMSIETQEIVRCVMEENVGALTKVPGVGKKTAERLIIDMKDRLKSWSYEPSSSPESAPINSGIHSNLIVSEAEGALLALGYKPVDASKAVSRVYDETITTSQELIRRALKSMLPV
ncbi:MAG: Holliday junction DNA helicase RuvA [Flavobacteriales bacterium]|jgi:Holliday junction DNA helicase RuvA